MGRALPQRRAVLVICLALFASAAAAADTTSLLFEQLYQSSGVRGYVFSDVALGLRGKPVLMHGYMAPPLKPESRFFVLTRQPLALCPFCQSDAEWPVDIVVVYLE